VSQKLGPEGESGPWQIWSQTGILNRGPISIDGSRVANAFDTPLAAIAVADLLDEIEGGKMACVHNIIQ
jgi:hypothetical protein